MSYPSSPLEAFVQSHSELSVFAACRGLKWDSNGEVNYDTDMNVIGGGLLAGGTMCQPADTLLGAMNPYKTQAAATPLAMAEAADPTSADFAAGPAEPRQHCGRQAEAALPEQGRQCLRQRCVKGA